MTKHRHSGMHRLFGASVLVVDDDADAAELYAIWLRKAGHRVSIVGDGAGAMDLAPGLSPTVAVIDIGLPGMDGIELVRRLRVLPELARCRFIAITAYADLDLRARCRAAGFSAFFEKPMPESALVDCVLAAALSDETRVGYSTKSR